MIEALLLEESGGWIQAILMALASISAFPFLIWLGERIAQVSDDSDSTSDKLRHLPSDCETLHLVVLVHGLQNTTQSLHALRVALEKQLASSAKPGTAVVVHSSSSNVGRTTEGILPCGQRLGQEVNDLVDQLVQADGMKNPSLIKLTLFSNSLGGLIARAALPHIRWSRSSVSLEPHVFCSTNSPHLGSRGTLLFPLPSVLQYFVSVLYGTSMMDLFRYTDAMDQLHSTEALQLLGRFPKRIAYATVHRTDFQVPTSTAAFLSNTDSVHHPLTSYPRDCPFVVNALQTPPQPHKVHQANHIKHNKHDDDEWINHHAPRLDALGWIKVFCDVRSCLPSLPLWWLDGASFTETDNDEPWTSAQIRQVYNSHTPGRWYAPLAHMVFTGMLAGFKWGDRSVVDVLAIRLMEAILE